MAPGGRVVTRKVLLGGMAGGVALFVWSVVAWTLLPLHSPSVRRLPAEEQVIGALVTAKTSAGFYVIPGLPDPSGSLKERQEAMKAWEERAGHGPVATLVYNPAGRSPSRMFRPMIRGLALALACTLFSAWVLSRARIASHLGRVAFVLGMGSFSWFLGPAMQWNWFGYPGGHTLAMLADVVIGWAIVGVVQAGILRPVVSGPTPSRPAA